MSAMSEVIDHLRELESAQDKRMQKLRDELRVLAYTREARRMAASAGVCYECGHEDTRYTLTDAGREHLDGTA